MRSSGRSRSFASRAAKAAEQKKTRPPSRCERQQNPAAEADRTRDRQLRELADQAHGVNLDLGARLLKGCRT